MSKYIDEDKLWEGYQTDLCNYIACGECPFKERNGQCRIEQWVESQPTADVRENVYGKWIPKGEIDVDNNRYFVCSNCQHGDTHAVGVEVPFCWYCGAKMEEEEDNND